MLCSRDMVPFFQGMITALEYIHHNIIIIIIIGVFITPTFSVFNRSRRLVRRMIVDKIPLREGNGHVLYFYFFKGSDVGEDSAMFDGKAMSLDAERIS